MYLLFYILAFALPCPACGGVLAPFEILFAKMAFAKIAFVGLGALSFFGLKRKKELHLSDTNSVIKPHFANATTQFDNHKNKF